LDGVLPPYRFTGWAYAASYASAHGKLRRAATQLSGHLFPECEPSLKPLDMAFQGLGLHLGAVVVPHVVKQAAIVV
jgi:hypothetical protein